MESLILTLADPSSAVSRLDPWKSPFYPIAVLWLSFFYGMSIAFGGSLIRMLLVSLSMSFMAFTFLVAYSGAIHVYFSSTGNCGDVSRLLYGLCISLFPMVVLPIMWDLFGSTGTVGLLVLQAMVCIACARVAVASVVITYSTTRFGAVKALLFPAVLFSAFIGAAVMVLGGI